MTKHKDKFNLNSSYKKISKDILITTKNRYKNIIHGLKTSQIKDINFSKIDFTLLIQKAQDKIERILTSDVNQIVLK